MKILLVRVPLKGAPADDEVRALLSWRDMILDSMKTGVVVLKQDTEVRITDVPELGADRVEVLPIAAEAEETVPADPEPVEAEQIPKAPPSFTGRYAAEKRRISEELLAYRHEHGLGCWKALAEIAGAPVDDGTVPYILDGGKVDFAVWEKVGRALEILKKKEEENHA